MGPLGSLDPNWPVSSLEGDGSGTRPGGPDDLSLRELIAACALDGGLFAHTFFPRTARQKSPPFHRAMWALLQSPHRLINMQVFRGGAKTSLLRIFTAFRVAYGLSRTILLVGKSEGHAVRSLSWLRRQVQYNQRFAQIFDLRPGEKWAGNEITIYHGIEETPITLIAMGLTGSIRGVNVDDYRPDLIVVDDIVDEENSATVDQRNKLNRLVMGGLVQSLTPESEDPTAKLVMLQTPQDPEDLSMQALRLPQWHSARFPIWTLETEHLATPDQESAWPERWTSEILRAEKTAAIDSNSYAVWAREMELQVIKAEKLAFKAEWRQEWADLPGDGFNVLAIDPVPPPTEQRVQKGLQDTDYEAFVVVRVCRSGYYVLEAVQNRGHQPEWTVATFLSLCIRYNPRSVFVESIAYQAILAWILRVAMQRQGRYWTIIEVNDQRAKYTRIVDALHGVSSNRRLFFRPGLTELAAQFDRYPDVTKKDLLDALAMCIAQTTLHFWNDAADNDDSETTDVYGRPYSGQQSLMVAGDAP